jgi:hypothetical protein
MEMLVKMREADEERREERGGVEEEIEEGRKN